MQLFQQSEATAAQRRWYFACVDATDGFTAETGLTFSSGELQISKAGGAFANSAGTATELSDGMYMYEATQTELNTVGVVGFKVEKTGVRTALMQVGQVVPWDPYDAVRAGLTALPNANAEAAGGLYTRGTGTGQINQPSGGYIDVNTIRWSGGLVNNQQVSFGLLTDLELATDGSSTTITLHAGASSTNDIYKGSLIFLYGGTGAGQTRYITAYNGTTKVATVDTAWVTNPNGTTQFVIRQMRGYAEPPAAATIADSVWDEARSGHTASGSFGEGVNVYDYTAGSPALDYLGGGVGAFYRDVEAVSDSTHLDFIGANAGDDSLNGSWIYVYFGTGFTQSRQITDWDEDGGGPGIGRATVTPAWTTNPTGAKIVVWKAKPSVLTALASGFTPDVNVASITAAAITSTSLAASALSAIADAIWDEAMEGAKTARQWMRGIKSVLWGKAGFTSSGRTFRDDADTKNRITTSIDASGRPSVTEDLT